MRTHLGRNKQRIKLRMAQHGTAIVLNWTEFTGTRTTDPTTGEQTGGVAVPATATIYGFIHIVQPLKSGIRVHEELQQGDALIDLDPDETIIDNKKDLVFTFNGAQWVQVELGQRVVQSWDAEMSGVKLVRTVAVRRRT